MNAESLEGLTRLQKGEVLYNAWKGSGGGQKAIAKLYGLEEDTNRRLIGDYLRANSEEEDGGASFTETQSGAIVQSKSPRITTVDQLLKFCEVDLSIWEEDRKIINKWESKAAKDEEPTPLIQIKVWLKRREAAPYEAALEALLENLAKKAPTYKRLKPRAPTGEYCMIPNFYDWHVNKRDATGQYTIRRADSEFRAVVDATIERALSLDMSIERIMLPVGHDALHAEDLQGRTTRGTYVEMAGDMRPAIDVACDAYIYLAERMAEIARLNIFIVEDNHNRLGAFWLGKVLEARFARHKRITVTNSHTPRQYYRYGNTLIGMAHGDMPKDINLATLMPHEAPQHWTGTKYREYLTGHLHKKAKMFMPVFEDKGVLIRTFSSLSPPDKWHELHGFIGNHRAAETLFYHRQKGLDGSFQVFVDEMKG